MFYETRPPGVTPSRHVEEVGGVDGGQAVALMGGRAGLQVWAQAEVPREGGVHLC